MVGVWTMDELVERVRAALAAEYPGAPNGRVRDVPDRRAIRWYTTTGLVDRPAGMRGRTALYGPRHVMQLVAVKRRQAQGHSLAAIQAELAGASDAELAAAARVPPELLSGAGDAEVAAPGRPRFWTAAPATSSPSPSPSQPLVTEVGGVTLGGGAILVLPVRPEPADHAAIATAARPLLDLLAARGLLVPTPDLSAARDPLEPTPDDGSPS
ncbi:MerR family transcriptional regulator [Actinoplanes sp. NPDC049548]|uniref:MerR family transcriptional regulator n=1 Tax=Actinoplanes sp. NPDC049548 TaxID=3155152 RepID=UPI00341629F4